MASRTCQQTGEVRWFQMMGTACLRARLGNRSWISRNLLPSRAQEGGGLFDKKQSIATETR